jgi:hypothetical protein
MVDSRNRLIGSVNTIENFDICVQLPVGNKFNQVSVSSVVIPKSYYNIVDNSVGVSNAANPAPNSFVGSFTDNQFLLSEGTGSTSSALITVPLGFYNSINFPIQMKSLLETASPNNLTYEVTYPDPTTERDTRKFTYKCLDNTGALDISFFFPTVIRNSSSGVCKINDTSRISEIMGFTNETNAGIKTFALESGTIYSLTSEYVADFELTKYITIKSNIALDQGNATGDNAILGVIPVFDVPNGGVINYELQQLEDESKFLSNNNNNIYSFSLWDDHDERMKLNGINWFVKLFMYEYNPFYELAINDIRIKQLQMANNNQQQQQQPQ